MLCANCRRSWGWPPQNRFVAWLTLMAGTFLRSEKCVQHCIANKNCCAQRIHTLLRSCWKVWIKLYHFLINHLKSSKINYAQNQIIYLKDRIYQVLQISNVFESSRVYFTFYQSFYWEKFRFPLSYFFHPLSSSLKREENKEVNNSNKKLFLFLHECLSVSFLPVMYESWIMSRLVGDKTLGDNK